MAKPVTAVIVGAGHRGLCCGSYGLDHPDELKVVGVADKIELRRKTTAARFGFSEEMCFETAEDLASHGKLADCIINGTMDHQHVPTSLPLLEAGYDVLLEKPFATSETEMWTLIAAARQNDRKIAICHVLRHAPFYAAIRRRVIDGVIGDIINIQATEHVSYHQVIMGYVRGKRRRRDLCGCSMLMAKSCHDLDILHWNLDQRVKRLQSFGSLRHFRPENAPRGATARCTDGCPAAQECPFDARRLYLDMSCREWPVTAISSDLKSTWETLTLAEASR